nr:DUF4266 domain-containing protein [Chitinivorax tropicus]
MAVVCLNTGCAQVKPWEKGQLARDDMQAGGPYVMAGVMHEHVFSSKEASRGGNGVGGGGCGCN